MYIDKIKEQDSKYILHTYGRLPVAIKCGKGSRCEDYDGKKYIDFTAGIGVNALGYSNDEWLKAVTEQLQSVQHVCNYFITESVTDFAELIVKASGLNGKVFMANSGAEANECLIKIARKTGEAEGKYKIVTLNNSFHGRTLTTLAATGQDVFHQHFLPLTDGFTYVDGNDIDALAAAIDDKTCAVLIEGVQGEGGVIPMEIDYLKAVRKLCDEKGILMLMDEVQTGVGRTGTFFSYQAADILPDAISCAKGIGGGLPVGVTVVNEKLGDIFAPGDNGTTFGSNPVVAAGGCVIVKTVNNPEFLKSVNEKGAYIREKLEKMDKIASTRGRGMMIGALLQNTEMNAHDVMEKCAEKGLLILTAKEAIRFLPPLNITYEEIDEGLAIFESVLNG